MVLGGALVWAKMSGSQLLVRSQLPSATAPVVVARAAYDPAQVQKTLEFYAAQVRYDPGNAIFKASLAAQYLESYRETGDSADATRAEQAARASLAIRTHGNSEAYFQLSRALLTQHRFPEALVVARKAAVLNPVGLRECADIEIEVGDYDKATHDINASQKAVAAAARSVALVRGDTAPAKPDDDPAFLALASRLNELHGDSTGELELLTRAVKLADANADMPVQSVAWFHERLGRCLGMMGQLDEAEKSYMEGLRVFPRDYRTMAALAHLNAARGDWKEAIDWGQRAANIVPAPETLALLGDAYTALGDSQKAAAQFRLVEQIGKLSKAQGVIYDRQHALFYADHGRNLNEAVKLARGELRVRHDIYTYDTLAWTLFKAGQFAEAAANAKRALAFGTRDASLYFHAGMIAAAQGQNQLAQTYLQRALDINPYFHPTQPATARATLANLNAAPSPDTKLPPTSG
ncbi:hypothetical protein IAD21_01168 [Abditibacteriota bacterium]|nr:hypothetical protein IAD21_01168 [Abditibacteriota bacterium]